MNLAEMKTMFEGLVDDKLDDTLLEQLFNRAKSEIEMERDWEYLKEIDDTLTIQANSNYLTQYALPTRFLFPLTLYVGADRIPYQLVPLQERNRWRDITHRYYLDQKNSKFHICGTPAADPIYFFYIESTPDITSAQSWTFPSFAHPLIPIKAAKLFFSMDRVEKGKSFSPEWERQENLIRRMLHQWDAKLKKNAVNSSKFPFYPSTHPNIIH